MADQNPLVVMRSGPIPGSSYFLEKDEVLLGRDLANDIPVPDPEISRRHARFLRRADGYYIEDLGSTNGTFLNGARLTSPHRLQHGDLITLAENTVMSFELPAAQSAPAAQPPQSLDEVPKYETPAAGSQPSAAAFQPAQTAKPPLPAAPRAKKKLGWFAVFLLILLVAMIIIGLVLLFMPASWWCFISFNSLTGCPIY